MINILNDKAGVTYGVGTLSTYKNFTSEMESCVKCGLCSRICPAHNINRVDGVPKFGDNCINCFACIQWCYKMAISFGGKRLGLRKYTHPKVEAREMIEFNGNKETL